MRHLIDIPVHPAADIFPMLDEDAFTQLDNDIRVSGQLMPIRIWRGQIVDGRNRYAACIRAGGKPKMKDINFADDAECVRYIISTNVKRRHLNTSQRASIAAEISTLSHGGDRKSDQAAELPDDSQSFAAHQMQVSERLVRDAKMVQREAPDLAAKVKSGEMKVSKAASMARERVKTAAAVTDPNQADDAIVDATLARHAEGDTPKARAALAVLAKLNPTELSFIKADLLKMVGA